MFYLSAYELNSTLKKGKNFSLFLTPQDLAPENIRFSCFGSKFRGERN
jgi:hypothetical protein